MRAKLLQSRLTLCKPMDHNLPVSSVHGDSPDKNTGLGCHALLQGIFLIQGLNPQFLRLLHRLVGSFFITSATWETLQITQLWLIPGYGLCDPT